MQMSRNNRAIAAARNTDTSKVEKQAQMMFGKAAEHEKGPL